MTKIFIYTLSDSKGVRYVGQTKNLTKRLQRHMFDANSGLVNKRCSWIKSLTKRGEEPILDVIDVVELNNWSFWEQYWISQFRTWGFNLVNSTNGGEGSYGCIPTEITKLKMSTSKKGIIPKNIDLFKKSSIKGSIVQCDIYGNVLNEFESASYVRNNLKINNVSDVLTGKRKLAGGYIWKYKV